MGLDACILRYYRDGKHLASASINKDEENLEDELRLEGQMNSRRLTA
jgi:hypothetical protein